MHYASKGAIAAVEKAGGSVKVLRPVEPEREFKKGKAGKAEANAPKEAKVEAKAPKAEAKPAKAEAKSDEKPAKAKKEEKPAKGK